ncbi:hypothetical protein [Nisaea sediminum]|uniref:hypothetical protein n=1 Tax=Nisaea sediminum TaxID=2775867 RepID=UPI001865AC34|nr:hypothetical protein [Nisaea sediminum]
MVSMPKLGEARREYFADANLVKTTLSGTLTAEIILQEVRNRPDITRWNRVLWNYLDADLSELQFADSQKIVAAVTQAPEARQAGYKAAFVARPGPDQLALSIYAVLMEEQKIPGREFKIVATEDEALAWLMSDAESEKPAAG